MAGGNALRTYTAEMNGEKYRQPLLEVESILPILNRIAIFGGLDDTQLYTVFHLLETEHYNKGEFIFRKGESPSHIMIIRSGRVHIVEEVNGIHVELFEFNTGDCFGETSVIAIQPHSVDALAMDNAELLILPRQRLFALYDEDPRLFGMLMMNIAREACRRLKRTKNTMLQYALNNHPDQS